MSYISLFFLLISFSVHGRPKWINSPLEFCPPSELCAVGEASGAMIAEMAARDSLAKIFETRVSSDQTITTSSKTISDSEGPITGEVDEEVFQRIREFTQEVIQGAYIKQRFESSDAHFALVALPKDKASSILEDKMKDIDAKIVSFIADGRRSSLNKSLKLFKIRNNLHIRYRVLKDKAFHSPTSIQDIMSLKAKKRALGIRVKVEVQESSKTKELKKSVIESLVNNDYIISSNNYNFAIEVSLADEKQFLKVEGFVKYKFILQARSLNSKGEQVGALKYEIVQTGRSKQQSYYNAIPGLTKFIHEKFNELNID